MLTVTRSHGCSRLDSNLFISLPLINTTLFSFNDRWVRTNKLALLGQWNQVASESDLNRNGTRLLFVR